MYTVNYNGQSCHEVNLLVKKRPNIPMPQKRITEVVVPGRSGALHVDEGAYEEMELSVIFNFIEQPENWAGILRKIRNWLYREGDGRLIFSDDPQFYYKVSYVKPDDDTERKLKRLGYLTVVFVCEPYMYSLVGDEAVSLPCSLDNDGAEASPLYQIYGEGICTLTVNGSSVTANVGQELMIDTDLMVAFRGDAVENTSVTGNIDELRLAPGENTIEITDGFAATVVPRWRYL